MKRKIDKKLLTTSYRNTLVILLNRAYDLFLECVHICYILAILWFSFIFSFFLYHFIWNEFYFLQNK